MHTRACVFVRLLWTSCYLARNSNRLTCHKHGLLRRLSRQRGLLTSRPEFNSQGTHLWKRVSTNSHKSSFDLHVWAYDQTKKAIFKKNYFKSRGAEHCYDRWSLNHELKRDLPPSASCGLGCKACSPSRPPDLTTDHLKLALEQGSGQQSEHLACVTLWV